MNIRAATQDDAEAITRICNEMTRHLYDEDALTTAEVRAWFDLPALETALVERDGVSVGYMDVRAENDRVFVDVRVVPGAAHGGRVHDALYARAEDWARDNVPAGSSLRAFASERDDEQKAAIVRAGYELARHSFIMDIELPDELEQPRFPAGISVRTYGGEADERGVYETMNETFADHWDFEPTPIELWRHFMFRETSDPSLWWLAEDGDELAAVCINGWHSSGDRTHGWIGTLGVQRPWRKQGLGRALLLHSFNDFKLRGAARVGLGVDAENTTGAVRLYERVGMHPLRRNDTYWKTLT
jgi:ribosomal protein S18 acetylase RimI-like enzyme